MENPKILTLKFLKYDAFKNLMFCSTPEIHENTYSELTRLSNALIVEFKKNYNPCYKYPASRVISITFKNCNYEFQKDGIYKIHYKPVLLNKKKDGSPYVLLKIVDTPQFIKNLEPVPDVLFEF